MNPELLADRPANPQLILKLRSDPRLLEQTLDYHVNKKPLDFKTLPSAAFWIRSIVRGPDNGSTMKSALTQAPAQICGKKLRTGDVAFRCLTCSADPTCIMCRVCFNDSPCKNHEYRMISSGGGMCDCGDDGAWKKEGFCSKHSGQLPEEQMLKMVPVAVKNWLEISLRYAVLLFGKICLFVRAQPRSAHPKDEGSPLCIAAPSMLKELVDIAMISDDGRRLVSNALASTVLTPAQSADVAVANDPLRTMLFKPVGSERKSNFRPPTSAEKKKRQALRTAGDIDDNDDDDDDWDDDEDVNWQSDDDDDFDDEEDEEGNDEDGDVEVGANNNAGLDLEGLLAQLDLDAENNGDNAEGGNDELEGIRQLVRQLQQAQAQQRATTTATTTNETTNNNTSQKKKKENKKKKDQKEKNDKTSSSAEAAAATSSNNNTTASPTTISTSNNNNMNKMLRELNLAAAGSTTLENLTFVEMFMAMELCPFVISPIFSQAWQGIRALFDACASDFAFRKSYVRAISRVALPWASCNAKGNGLYSVAIQCTTVQPVVDAFLTPLQNVADNSTLISSLLSSIILTFSANDSLIPVGDHSEKVFQLAPGSGKNKLNYRAFFKAAAESYHPLLTSVSARVACIMSRPLLRAYLTVLTLMHFNHFSRQESAPPLPRTSWDFELSVIRHILSYGKATGEIVKSLLLNSSATSTASSSTMRKKKDSLDNILGISRELLEHIYSDCALHPILTQLEKRSASFSSIINNCSAEPFQRLNVRATSRPATAHIAVIEFLSNLLQDCFSLVGRHERAIARRDKRTNNVVSWSTNFKFVSLDENDYDQEDEDSSNSQNNNNKTLGANHYYYSSSSTSSSSSKSVRVLQRPYDILRQRHPLGFHFPGIRFISALILSTLRAFTNNSGDNNNSSSNNNKLSADAANSSHHKHHHALLRSQQQKLVLQQSLTRALAKVSEAYPDTIPNLLDRVIMCNVITVQQLDNLWKRDFAGYTPHLHYYQNFDSSYFSELDHYFIQCITAGVSSKLVASLALERFSYTPQDDRVDAKAAPFGYAHFLRMMLCIACDTTRTCETYRAEVRNRLLIHLAIAGAEVRSRLLQSCAGSNAMDDEDSKHGEDILQECIVELTESRKKKDATAFCLKEAAWEEVPMYSGSVPPSFASIARNEFNDRFRKGTSTVKAVKPVAKSTASLHGPAFRETLPLILQEEETINVSLFLLFSRACGVLQQQSTSSAKDSSTSTSTSNDKYATMCAVAKKWRGNNGKPLTISPTGFCTAIDALAVGVDTVFDFLNMKPNSSKPIDWTGFENHLQELRRDGQWQVQRQTSNNTVSDFKPLRLSASSSSGTHHVASLLLRNIEAVKLNSAFKYYGGNGGNCDFTLPSFLESLTSMITSNNNNSNNKKYVCGIDVIEILLAEKENLLSDVAPSTDCDLLLEKVVRVVKDYETYLQNPKERDDQIAAAKASNNQNDDDDADGNNGDNNNRSKEKDVKKGPSAKERASAALAALKKKKMAKMTNFLQKTDEKEEAAAAKTASSSSTKHVDPTSSALAVGENEDSAASLSSSSPSSSSMMFTSTSSSSMMSAVQTADFSGEGADQVIIRQVVDGPALHRYVRSFVDDSVCAYCHRPGIDKAPLYHLGHISNSGVEHHLCRSGDNTTTSSDNKNNSSNTTDDNAEDSATNSKNNTNTPTVVKSTTTLNFCGHFTHSKCFTDRIAVTKRGLTNTNVFTGHVRGSHYLNEGEVLCAICARVNSVILPSFNTKVLTSLPSSKDVSSLSKTSLKEKQDAFVMAFVRAQDFGKAVLAYNETYNPEPEKQQQQEESSKNKDNTDNNDSEDDEAKSEVTIDSDDDERKVDNGDANKEQKKKTTTTEKNKDDNLAKKQSQQKQRESAFFNRTLDLFASSLVNVALDLQLGKRVPMLREVSAYCSMFDTLRRLYKSDDNSSTSVPRRRNRVATSNNDDDDDNNNNNNNTSSSSPPITEIVKTLLLELLESKQPIESLLDGPLQHLKMHNFDDITPSINFLLKAIGKSENDTSASSSSSSFLETLSSSLQNDRNNVGKVSFWARLFMIVIQCITGRLTDVQFQNVAESVLRAASNTDITKSDELIAYLHEVASDAISFPLWAPVTASSSSSNNNNNNNNNNLLGLLDSEKEFEHVSTILRFLEQREDAVTRHHQNNDNDNYEDIQQQQQQDDPSNDNNNNNTQKDTMVNRIVSVFHLPTSYLELLPKMQKAKDQTGKSDDEKKKKGYGNNVNDPLPDSDDEPEDEEERQRLEERRQMERREREEEEGQENDDNDQNNKNSNNTAHTRTDEDDNVTISVESEASYVCAECGTVPRIPVMCFFCRKIYCARGNPPELTEHSKNCAGGCGVYMQMKVTQPLVMQVKKRAQTQPSPYLDKFGEEDVSLRRGRPLSLNMERYRAFLRMAIRCGWDHHTAMLEDGHTWKTISAL